MVLVIPVLVYAEQAIRSNLPVQTITVHCYQKCDWEALQEDMMIVLREKVEKYEDIDQTWNCWKSMFLEVLNKHAPLKIIRPRKNQLPWIDDDIWKLILDAQ